MTFMRGKQVDLVVLQEGDYEADRWTSGVMSGLTTEHLFTGSLPMRAIDIKAQWRKEREAGDVLFGIFAGPEFTLPGPAPNSIPTFIGTCGLHSHRNIYRSWEARFIIFDIEAVGKGLGKEVVTNLTRYAFERLNAHRVWLGVSEDNLRAVKCYLDCGYRIEGRLRDELFYHGKYHSALRMAAMEGEWGR